MMSFIRARFSGGERHAGVLETVHEVLLQLPVDRGRGLDGKHAPVELLALQPIGAERVVLEQARLGGLAHGLVGRYVGQQVDRALDILDADLHGVERMEDCLHAGPGERQRLDGGDRLPGARQAGVAECRDVRGGVEPHGGMTRRRGVRCRSGQRRGENNGAQHVARALPGGRSGGRRCLAHGWFLLVARPERVAPGHG
ncbi:MAG: hypothetical protein IPI73_10880 [Betaproteobacteria bacterium]|nr:hypothetical protein [Betaproteobacteria bacterium]